jgi:hypothetical protein
MNHVMSMALDGLLRKVQCSNDAVIPLYALECWLGILIFLPMFAAMSLDSAVIYVLTCFTGVYYSSLVT